MSMPSSRARTPNDSASFALSAISAACSSALVGMQPRCRQVPPTLSRSMRATRLPSSAARSARAWPPLPPPRMTMSYRPLLSATDPLLALCSLSFALTLSARLEPPVRHVLRELDQRPGRGARAALGGIPMRAACVERRARNIQVRPAGPVRHEPLEEQPGDQHPATTALPAHAAQLAPT